MNHSQVLVQVSFTAEDPDRARNKMRRCLWYWYIKCILLVHIHNYNCGIFFGSKKIWKYIVLIALLTAMYLVQWNLDWKQTWLNPVVTSVHHFFLQWNQSLIKFTHNKLPVSHLPIHVLYQLFPFSRHLYILKQQLYPIYVLSVKFNDQLLSKDISFCFQTLF